MHQHRPSVFLLAPLKPNYFPHCVCVWMPAEQSSSSHFWQWAEAAHRAFASLQKRQTFIQTEEMTAPRPPRTKLWETTQVTIKHKDCQQQHDSQVQGSSTAPIDFFFILFLFTIFKDFSFPLSLPLIFIFLLIFFHLFFPFTPHSSSLDFYKYSVCFTSLVPSYSFSFHLLHPTSVPFALFNGYSSSCF